MTPFSQTLHTLRRSRAMTQKELAEKLKLKPSYMSFLETGRRLPPSEDILKRIAEVLALSPAETALLEQHAEESQNVFKLPRDLTPSKHQLAVQFFNQLGSLSSGQVEVIRKVIVAQ